ncbi:MAG: hypothetical protein JWQ08_2912, partial [Deinococcus sp.]|nr:hypothetical protein [Deinococcus sp.]
VHVLPFAVPVPQVPDHPALLPYSDEGLDSQEAYVVTELPLHAVPASDPLLAARGALAGLAALHAAGLIHGGVSASQLWSVDGYVALAGAGLPWSGGQGSPEDDLQALAEALAVLGGVPEPLRPLREKPGTLTAQTALARLHSATTSQVQVSAPPQQASAQPHSVAASAPAAPTSAPRPVQTQPQPVGSEPVQSGSVQSESLQVEAVQRREEEEHSPPALPHDGSPIVLSEVAPDGLTSADAAKEKLPTAVVDVEFAPPPDALTPLAEPPAVQPDDLKSQDSPEQEAVSSAPVAVQSSMVQASPAGSISIEPISIDLDSDPSETAVTITPVWPPTSPEPAPSLPAVSPVSAYSNAPPGVAETPQERRKRQNDERRAQAMQDSRAAAERKAAARREREAAQPAVVQIEFDDLPDLPAPESAAAPPVGMRFPDSVNVERVPASMRRAPLPPEDSEPSEQRAVQEVGRLPGRRTQGEPIRIGWAEDDSWRVVRGPGQSAPARRTAPRWLLPLLAALLLIGGAVWAYLALPASTPPKTPAAAAESGSCCTVRFTVQGAAGVTARLTVIDAPDGANLTPGQEVGLAPGPIKLPVRGTYRLRVAADGYAPGTLSVSAPNDQPIRIDLGP